MNWMSWESSSRLEDETRPQLGSNEVLKGKCTNPPRAHDYIFSAGHLEREGKTE